MKQKSKLKRAASVANPLLLAEPIQIANPIIPQIKNENDDVSIKFSNRRRKKQCRISLKPEDLKNTGNNNDNVAVWVPPMLIN